MKYEITIMREDDDNQGLADIGKIIQNGLARITADVTIEEMSNCVTLSFDATPESIETARIELEADLSERGGD